MQIPEHRRPVQGPMKIECADHHDPSDAAAWDAVADAARLRSPFQGWTWQSHWAEVFAEGRRLDVRHVRDADGRLVAILPLCETAPGALELLGGAEVSDYLDLIAVAGHEDDAWAALLASRAADGVRWILHAVPAASPTVRALPGLAATVGLAADVTLEERCPVLGLPSSWETYLASLSGKHRHELTRKIRRLQRDAPDARVSSASAPAEIEPRLGEFFHLHRRSLAGKARFMDSRMEQFFR